MKVLNASLILVGLIALVCGGESQHAKAEMEMKECRPEAGAEASRRFAYDLYAKTLEAGDATGNVFLAPTTVATAFAMLLAGARGATKEQLLEGLMFKNTSEEFDEDNIPCLLRSYSDDLPQKSVLEKSKGNDIVPFKNPLILRTASKLFGDKGYEFDRNFITKTKKYGAKMTKTNFGKKPEAARKKINRWVEMMTEDKIQDLFGEDSIDADTKLVIASAIYFEGLWKTPFDSERNFNDSFNVNANEVVQAEFMRNEDNFKYIYSYRLSADLLELPYKGDAFGRYDVSMILILPLTSMENLERKLTEDNLAPEIAELLQQHPHNTHVRIPKFKISVEYDLKPIMRAMGMENVFIPGVADLSGMVAPTSKDMRPLYVSSAVHKTFIEVDEKGTKAAGATGLTIVPLSLPPIFYCNKPFMVMIYEKKTQSILFIGKITDPTV